MNKRIYVLVFVLALFVFCASVTARGAEALVAYNVPSGHGTALYADAMAVKGVEQTGPEEYTVTLRAANGNVFQFYTIDCDWFVNDLAAVLMDDNGTPEVCDDMILAAKYAGCHDPATW